MISPEAVMSNSRMMKWWMTPAFTGRILNFIFDEGHCVRQWGGFRKEYLTLGNLRHIISNTIPFYVTSATLSPAVLIDVGELLHLRPNETEKFLMSNDRPDLQIMVRSFVYPMNSYRDLAFLIPERVSEDSPPPKFVVFFDDTKETEEACDWFRNQLPNSLRLKVGYFHSTMTQEYREENVEVLRESKKWGYFSSESYGVVNLILSVTMHILTDRNQGMDVPDIKIIVQYKATCNLSTLWQRFGRAARKQGLEATVILLVEKTKMGSEEVSMSGLKRKALQALDPGQAKRVAYMPSMRSSASKPPANPAVDDPQSIYSPFQSIDSEKQLTEEEWVQKKKADYIKADRTIAKATQASKGKCKPNPAEVGTPIYDFINPRPKFPCRRAVLNVYFDNDKRCKSLYSH
jgi:superfamily II DNA/RNA helicase